jgi:hypothetical protein
MTTSTRRLPLTFFLGLNLLVGFLSLAKAQVANFDIFEEDFLNQTGDSTETSSSWSFSARVFLTNPDDASSASVTAPDSTTYSLTSNGASQPTYQYQQGFADQTSLQEQFPSGAYTFGISGGTLGSDSGTVTLPSNGTLPFPSAIPSFTNFTAFQNLNASQAFTFTFAGFTNLTSGETSSNLFFTIFDASGDSVFSESFLPSTTTSILLPANELASGEDYTAALVYDNRVTEADAGFDLSSGGVNGTAGYDYNTSAAFSTAPAPEPSIWAMLILGGLVSMGLRRFCSIGSLPV